MNAQGKKTYLTTKYPPPKGAIDSSSSPGLAVPVALNRKTFPAAEVWLTRFKAAGPVSILEELPEQSQHVKTDCFHSQSFKHYSRSPSEVCFFTVLHFA